MLGRDEKISPSKLNIAQYAIVVIFSVLCVGLWRLQVSGKEKYSAQAEGNSVRDVDVLAPDLPVSATLLPNVPSLFTE